MKHLDRGLQHELLNQLAEAYPEQRKDVLEAGDPRSPTSVNLHYLQEHGLVKIGNAAEGVLLSRQHQPDEPKPRYRGVAITAPGIDFLEDDGGLSAILGTVTVRLHADTIRDLVAAKIADSDKPPTEKRRLLDALKRMPEEGLKRLSTRLIDEGLSSAPGAWQALTHMLS